MYRREMILIQMTWLEMPMRWPRQPGEYQLAHIVSSSNVIRCLMVSLFETWTVRNHQSLVARRQCQRWRVNDAHEHCHSSLQTTMRSNILTHQTTRVNQFYYHRLMSCMTWQLTTFLITTFHASIVFAAAKDSSDWQLSNTVSSGRSHDAGWWFRGRIVWPQDPS